jgi:hypothetical protein
MKASAADETMNVCAVGAVNSNVYDGVVLPARDVFQRGADEVHDARRHRGVREDRLDRFGEPFEAVDTCDEDVADAALLEVGEDLHPELRALVGLKPQPRTSRSPSMVIAIATNTRGAGLTRRRGS